MTYFLQLPVGSGVHLSHVRELFDEFWRNREMYSELRVVVPTAAGYLRPNGLCALALELLRAKRHVEVTFSGDLKNSNRVANYLSRSNLFGLLGISVDGLPAPRLDLKGTHFPLHLVRDEDDVYEAVNALVEILLRQTRCNETAVAATEWALNELIDNVIVHASSAEGAVVVGQTSKRHNLIAVSVGDLGQGILSTLSNRYLSLRSSQDAILRAVEPGVTRDPAIGQGNGLTGSRQIAELSGGYLTVASSEWSVRFSPDSVRSFSEYPFPGTQVDLLVRTHDPIRLDKTLLGDTESVYIQSMFENETGERVLRVLDHTRNCGNRPIGEEMRLLLRNISGVEVDGVTIDFRGIRSISSSFADEFIGKFADEVGLGLFRDRFRIVTDSSLHNSIINRALDTRPSRG